MKRVSPHNALTKGENREVINDRVSVVGLKGDVIRSDARALLPPSVFTALYNDGHFLRKTDKFPFGRLCLDKLQSLGMGI